MVNIYKVIWVKADDRAIIPKKGRHGDAGFDTYSLSENIIIYPLETVVIDTGIKYKITEGWHLIIKERGSTGKLGLKVSAGVNDNNFRGTIKIMIFNANKDAAVYIGNFPGLDKPQIIDNVIKYPRNKAIAQLVPIYSPDGESVEGTEEDLDITLRRDKMLGSSGN